MSDDSFDALLREIAHVPDRDLPQEEEPSLTGQTLDHFRVGERLGQGGMSVVYRARDLSLERDVAIKVLRKRYATERRELVRREAVSTAQLNHPNIAVVYEVGSAEGLDFIVMEYVEGRSLRLVFRDGDMRADDAERYARQIAEGLAAAHARGIVHRDLKPENVMVTPSGRIEILDFGLARSSQDAHGDIGGTRRYMAPEQTRGEGDVRVDVYAFGVVLKELGELSPSMARRWAPLVAKCTATDPAARPANGAALVAALATPKRRPVAVALAVVALAAVALAVAMYRSTPARGRHRLITHNDPSTVPHVGVLSPDGKQYLVVDDDGHITHHTVDSDVVRKVPFVGKARNVGWSNDQKQLYVVTDEGNDKPSVISRFDLATSANVELLRGDYEEVAPSPDDTHLLLVSVEDGVFVSDLDGKNVRHLVTLKPGQKLFEAMWSPYGRRVGFFSQQNVSVSNVRWAIETVSVEGGAVSTVIDDPRLRCGISGLPSMDWSSNGRIVYTFPDAPPKEGTNLWAQPVDEQTGNKLGEPMQLTHLDGVNITNIESDTTSALYLYYRYQQTMGISVADVGPDDHLSAFRSLTRARGGDLRPTGWNGDRVLYTGRLKSGELGLYEQGIDHGEPTQFLVEDDRTSDNLVAASDGSELYWRLPVKGHPGPVVLWRKKDGVAEAIFETKESIEREGWSQSMSLDCATRADVCVASEAQGKDVVFWRLTLPEMKPVEWLRLDNSKHEYSTRIWGLSSDGARIAIAKRSDHGELVIASPGSSATRVVHPATMLQGIAWGHDDRALLIASNTPTEPQPHYRIYRLPIDDAPAQVLYESGVGYLSRARLSRDGKHLAVASFELEMDGWLFEPNALP